MAYKATMSVEFQKQGKSKGESVKSSHKETIEVLYFDYEVRSPLDAATGRSAGRAQHLDVTVVKEHGAASAQFLRAAADDEQVKSMTVEFWSVDKTTGEERIHHTLTLSDGRIARFKAATSHPHVAVERTTHELDEIRFSFDKIQIEDRSGASHFQFNR